MEYKYIHDDEYPGVMEIVRYSEDDELPLTLAESGLNATIGVFRIHNEGKEVYTERTASLIGQYEEEEFENMPHIGIVNGSIIKSLGSAINNPNSYQ